jgi:hypothetical protein
MISTLGSTTRPRRGRMTERSPRPTSQPRISGQRSNIGTCAPSPPATISGLKNVVAECAAAGQRRGCGNRPLQVFGSPPIAAGWLHFPSHSSVTNGLSQLGTTKAFHMPRSCRRAARDELAVRDLVEIAPRSGSLLPTASQRAPGRRHRAVENGEDDLRDGDASSNTPSTCSAWVPANASAVLLRPCERDRLRRRILKHREGLGLPVEPLRFFALLVGQGELAPELLLQLILGVRRGDDRGCGRVEMNQWIASADRPVLPMPWPLATDVRLLTTSDSTMNLM